jgi:hypothetical protein
MDIMARPLQGSISFPSFSWLTTMILPHIRLFFMDL